MIKLEDIVDVLNAELIGQSVDFDNVCTDTRTIAKNNLFVALTGPNFDGHDYLSVAEEKQAAAAIVTREVETHLPLLKVNDSIEALGRLAAYHRSQFHIPIAAVTGSCGKTTTKSMIDSILRQKGRVLSSKGNMNNQIGCPLSLLRLGKEHEFAIIEMGANAPGEIQNLCGMAKPQVTVVTNVAPAHLEGFGSIKGVATAKSEIYQSLPQDGWAVINADDKYRDFMIKSARAKNFLTFGIQNPADVQARNITINSVGCPEFTLIIPQGRADIRLPLVGEHNVMNALAAAGMCVALGASLEQIKVGLETVEPVDMRLVRREGIKGAIVYDDTYNANPLSFDAALHVLSLNQGRKLLVVGDMGELGANAKAFHEELGVKAKNLTVDRLFTIGELSQHTAEAFGKNASCYQSHDALIADLRDELGPDVAILVKGSRKAQMETVVHAITQDA